MHMLRTPVTYWQNSISLSFKFPSRKPFHAAILHYLVRISGTWIIEKRSTSDWFRSEIVYDYIANLLQSEDVVSDLVDDEPLLLAILRRSANELETCISSGDDDELRNYLRTSTYLVPLLSWPTGLRIVVASGLLHEADALAQTFWMRVLQLRIASAIRVLLQYNEKVSLSSWYEVNYSWYSIILAVEYDSGERAKWSEVFDALSVKLQSDTSKNRTLRNMEKIQDIFSPYHTDYLTLEAAQSAWKAGFRDVNSARICHGTRGEIGTPLWALSSRVYLKLNWTLFSWLQKSGVNPFWIHPKFLTTPAHELVRKASEGAAIWGSVAVLRNLNDVTSSPERDDCECHCSLQGCLCIGCAVSTHRLPHSSMSSSAQERAKAKQIVQPYVFNIVYQHKQKSWISSAVLRMLTFERLSLTHTCCYEVHRERRGRAQRKTEEEANVIHEQERDGLELLDHLVTDFEAKWAAYDKPFVAFMNRVWKRRMRQVEMDGQADREAYQAEVLRMGIRLENSPEDQMESDSDWPDEYESDDEREGWYTTDEKEDEDGTEEEA